MVKNNRLDWSRKRVVALVVASGTTALILGLAGHRMFEPNTLPPILWFCAFANMVQWCAYLATTLRDEIKEMLRPVESKVEEIDQEVCDYGDRREAEGAAIALQIVGQRSRAGRHLNPVE